jgi:sugar phosphate isomerase/epimerase
MRRCVITDQVNSDFEEALRKCRKLGYPSVEIHSIWGKTIEQLSEEEAFAAADLLKKYDIHAVVLASTLFLMVPLRDSDVIRRFDPTYPVFMGTYNEHVTALQHTLKIAKIIGASGIRVFSFRAPENRIVIGDEDDQFQIIEKFRIPVKMAEHEGITLLLENCPFCHLPKGTMTKRITDHFQSPQFKLLWSPAHSYQCVKDRIPRRYLNMTLEEEMRSIFKQIGHIHITDLKYVLHEPKPFKQTILGQGDIAFKEILQILKDGDYRGYCSLQSELNVPDTIVSMIVFNSMLESMHIRR